MKYLNTTSIAVSALAAAVCLGFAACDPTLNSAAVTGVSLPQSLNLTEGDSIFLTAMVAPENAANKAVEWSTDDASIASIRSDDSEAALIRAIAAGATNVRVVTADGRKTAKCAILVTSRAPQDTTGAPADTLPPAPADTIPPPPEPPDENANKISWNIGYCGDGGACTPTDAVKAILDTITGEMVFKGTGRTMQLYCGGGNGWYENPALNLNCSPYRSRITSIVVENGVTSIAESIITGMGNLTSISIGSGVTYIHRIIFYLPLLTAISVDASNARYASVDGVLFSKNRDTILQYPRAKTASSYAIPNGVTTIGSEAFAACLLLISVTVPSGVATIGSSAFSGCSSLTSITLPDGLTRIESSAFSGCSSLTSIALPDGLTYIGSYAFNGCTRLFTVTIPASVTYVGDMAFAETQFENNQPDGMIIYGSSLMRYKGKLPAGSHFVIPDGITNIAAQTFRRQGGLVEITIPNSVTEIGYRAFEGCPNLARVNIGSGLSTIYESMGGPMRMLIFANEKQWADGNSGGSSAVETSMLSEFNISPDNPYMKSVDGVAFSKDMAVLLQYPAAKTATEYTTPAGVRRIDEFAFSSCKNLDSVVVSEGVDSIGGNSFQWSGLISLTLPSTLDYIVANQTFIGIESLASIYLNVAAPRYYCGNNYSNGCLHFWNKENMTLYVPAASVAAYRAANWWKEFGHILAIP